MAPLAAPAAGPQLSRMYSSNSEPVRFERDCDAVMVPQGEAVQLPAGSIGYITQALGGSFTVFVEGNLFRIAGRDADAIGKEPPVQDASASAGPLEERVWDQLRTCFDPEIPVNIVDLGLIYDCSLDPPAAAGGGEPAGQVAHVKMTLTAPGCGMGQVLADDVKRKVEGLAGISRADVELVFDPPWNQNMMSEGARLQLGFFFVHVLEVVRDERGETQVEFGRAAGT